MLGLLDSLLLDSLILVIMYLVLLVMVLISVAFVTLMEQKILGCAQIRLGPNYVGYWGIFQPFADAIKLFSKESVGLISSNLMVYYGAPVIMLSVPLILWLIVPVSTGGLDFKFAIFFFICVSGFGVYPILSSGWSSNCKYSMLGSLRAVAQMISYEVSLAMILLSVVWVSSSFNVYDVLSGQALVWNCFFFFFLCIIWFVSSLAETNRTPYDFAEGESELVSGFNTEYSAGGFTMIFMAEYASILFMSMFFSVLFLGGPEFGYAGVLKTMVVSVWFVWVRATLPRYRYDKLMGLAWKSFLPVSLLVFIYYLGLMN
uniref:NADH-ubiquinone oxidoreductase chain 1 n=1 Tax=Alicella gigantea TaxID=1315966 RepID=A0A5B7KUP2_9CRUS|nr:NADH dehydrogenase subunit 1 [Alicella gigantea]QAT19470.1 NADH dehydrogenase subunit 1 [Alicella gigantea]